MTLHGQTPDPAPDTELLERFASGDPRAARVLTERLAPRIMALAVRMLGDRADAEDVTQEAMLRLWRVAPDWQDRGASVATWLYRVAGNLCIDRLRRRRPVDGIDTTAIADPAPGPQRGIEAAEQAAALQAALAALPERQRLAVVLRHLEERGNAEIAAVLDTSIEAVESLLARARRSLAERLAERKLELGLADDA